MLAVQPGTRRRSSPATRASRRNDQDQEPMPTPPPGRPKSARPRGKPGGTGPRVEAPEPARAPRRASSVERRTPAAPDERTRPIDVGILVRSFQEGRDGHLLRKLRLAGVDPTCDLRGVDLSGCDLHGLDLRGVDFSEAELRWVDLADARLEQARFTGTVAVMARLEAAHCRGVDFTGALLRQANLRDADLREADLRAAQLSEASLLGATIGPTTRADEDLTLLAAAAATPDRLTTGLDGLMAGITEQPPGPLVLALLIDSAIAPVLTAALHTVSGIDPAFYEAAPEGGPFLPYLRTTVEEIGVRLEGRRRDLRYARRQAGRGGNVDATARDDLHVGALAILARAFAEAEEHLSAARTHLIARRKSTLAATATALQACLALERLDPVNAVRRLRTASEMAEQAGDRQGQARFALGLLVLAILHSEWDRAEVFRAQIEAALAGADPERLAPLQHAVLGVLAWRQAAGATARAQWHAAAQRLEAQGHLRDAGLFLTLVQLSSRLDARLGRQL